jgi:SAM-dependent methyltransferase
LRDKKKEEPMSSQSISTQSPQNSSPQTASPTEFDKINDGVFHAETVTNDYEAQGMTTSESVALLKYSSYCTNRDILDIGIGTGRTSRVFKAIARRYVGIDYSIPMVNHVRRHQPDVDVHQADMRDLSRWAVGSFDLVFGSNNVIDAVQHKDRLKVLQEVRRVLRPNGLFMFSTHNRSVASEFLRLEPQLQRSRNPFTLFANYRRFKMQEQNYLKSKAFHVDTDEYAIKSDEGGHDFSLLLYFIDPINQRQQLANNGFKVLDAMGRNGRCYSETELGEQDASVLYIAQRLA